MATGIIGVISGTASLSYTPVNPAKVQISFCGQSGNTSVNGVAISSAATQFQITHYVGAGQTITVSTANSSAVVSALEG